MNGRKDLLKSIVKHSIIMVIACVIATISIYLSSLRPNANLHPNAYRDMIRSIVVVYVLVFVLVTVGKYLLKRYIGNNSDGDSKINLKAYFDRITPYETIAISFTLLTFVNSIMMLTGIDAPKEGVFAYQHMMTRLGIISLIVGLISFKEIIERAKAFDYKRLNVVDVLFSCSKKAFVCISKTFTNITIVYCLFMIAFQGAFTNLGGRSFYLSLLIIALLISLIRTASGFVKSKDK